MIPISADVRIAIIISIGIGMPALVFRYWHRLKSAQWAALLAYAGTMSNLLVVSVNHWQMPVVGCYYIPDGLVWKVADVNSHLTFLADRFQSSIGVYSIGDVAIIIGAVMYAVLLSGELVFDLVLRRIRG